MITVMRLAIGKGGARLATFGTSFAECTNIPLDTIAAEAFAEFVRRGWAARELEVRIDTQGWSVRLAEGGCL